MFCRDTQNGSIRMWLVNAHGSETKPEGFGKEMLSWNLLICESKINCCVFSCYMYNFFYCVTSIQYPFRKILIN